MNQIEQMIHDLCPDGVEFRKLGEVTAWDKNFNGVPKEMQPKIIPYKYLLAKEADNLIVEGGDVYILNTGNKEAWTTKEKAGDYLAEGEVVSIPWGGYANVKYYKGAFVTTDNRIMTSLDTKILDNKFLYYFLKTQQKVLDSFYRGAGIKHPNMFAVLSLEIPLPPLPIQRRIAEILDKFTELEAELEAELDCRKRQYEYYRNQLLTFANGGGTQGVTWLKMSEIGTIFRGTSFQKKHFVESGVPCIHYGQIYTHYGTATDKTLSFVGEKIAKNKTLAQKGDLVIATTSENVEDVGKATVWLGENNIVVSNDACFFRHKQNPKYLAYIFQSKLFFDFKKRNCTGTKVIRINPNTILDFTIPIPSLQEQRRIVAILDRFEALTTDLQAGLPAEIEARRKQYEYFRDKLLSFKDKATA